MNSNDWKGNKQFILILVVMAYFFLITFVGVPISGERYADLIVGFLTGTLFKSFMGRG